MRRSNSLEITRWQDYEIMSKEIAGCLSYPFLYYFVWLLGVLFRNLQVANILPKSKESLCIKLIFIGLLHRLISQNELFALNQIPRHVIGSASSRMLRRSRVCLFEEGFDTIDWRRRSFVRRIVVSETYCICTHQNASNLGFY